MKTTFMLLILLTMVSLNTLAYDVPHTILEGHTEGVWDIRFSPDGKTLISRGNDEIGLWDMKTGGLKDIYKGDISDLAYSPDGQTLAFATWDARETYLWDVETGERKNIFARASNLEFSPDGQILAIEDFHSNSHLIDVATGTLKISFEGDPLAFSPDSQTIVSANWRLGRATILLLLDVETGAIKTTFEGYRGSVVFSPDGQILAIETQWGTSHLWDVETGKPITTFEGGVGVFSPDSRYYMGVNTEGIHLSDVETGKPKVSFIGQSFLGLSPNGETLVSRSENVIHLRDVETGKHKVSFVRHREPDWSFVFSPDGQTLASVGYNKFSLWDVETGDLITGEGRQSRRGVFSPDSRYYVGTYSDEIHLWDVETGIRKAILRGHTDSVGGVAFSPDGNTLASGSSDQTIRLWHLSDVTTHVSVTPSLIKAPFVGGQFTVNIDITQGKTVGGYQFSIEFDETALRYVESANGGYLPPGAFVVPPVSEESEVTLAATSLGGTADGDGALVTVTFEVIDLKESVLTLSNGILTDSDGIHLPFFFSGALVTHSSIGPEDVNGDGVVNILDLVLVASSFNQRAEKEDINGDGVVNIVDLVKVAGALGAGGAAPSIHPQTLAPFTAADVQKWITQAQHLNLADATSQRGIRFLEHILVALTPKETILLPNYPNPLNPETWIPYQLAEAAEVRVSIYAVDGTLVRQLELGHQRVGIYQSRSRAAYWDGRNESGEPVASGVYFYTLSAGDFTATRKLLIRK